MRTGRLPGGFAGLLVIKFLAGCGGGAGTEASPARTETIAVGVAFEFTPHAAGSNSGNVVYSASNVPSWASFDETTGRIGGTPPPGSEGVYGNIVISANDGTNASSVSLTIEVVSQGDASISLSWTAPLEYEDGSALTDLAGYVIYYGTSAGDYDASVTIKNAGITTYLLEGLTPGTYYLVATAVNSAGVESRFSKSVTREAQ